MGEKSAAYDKSDSKELPMTIFFLCVEPCAVVRQSGKSDAYHKIDPKRGVSWAEKRGSIRGCIRRSLEYWSNHPTPQAFLPIWQVSYVLYMPLNCSHIPSRI